MDIKEIVVKYLKDNKYDGLCHPDTECGCFNGDLFPCDPHYNCDCQPGYKGIMGPNENEPGEPGIFLEKQK